MAEDVTRVLVDASTTPGADHVLAAATEGTRVGRYVVGKQLGVGGMGEVYAAEDPELGRKVALKFVRLGRGNREEGRSRLLREAQALAQLNHPNVVTIYDAGTYGSDRTVYVAMEYIEGVTLRDWLADGHPWPDVLRVLIHAGRGLAAAHRAGIVHRDFKPQNVMLDAGENPRVRVLDFGLALGHGPASVDEAKSGEVSFESSDSSLSGPLTETGTVLGTPGFMAPEQFAHQTLDARTDQFAFCTTAYRALYEGQPYAGDNGQEIRRNILKGRLLSPPQGTKVPARVFSVLARGLEANPDRRWPSMEEILHRLERAQPNTGRSRLLVPAVILGTVGIAAGLVWASQRGPRCDSAGEKLAGVWDSARRTEVEAVFSASNLPYAPRMKETVLTGLDGYAEAWVAKRVALCEAGDSITPQQIDAGIACLDRRLVEAAALVDVLREADTKVIENGAESVSRLRSVDVCDEDDAQLRLDPPGPEIAGAVQALELDMARIDALTGSGKYHEAQELAAIVHDRAAELGYMPVLANASIRVGQLAERLGDVEAAEEAYQAARDQAADCGETWVEARALIGMASITGLRRAQPEEALTWIRHAEAAVERAGSPPELAVHLEVCKGNAYFTMGDSKKAAEHQRRAVELAEGHPETLRFSTAARNNLAGALAGMGHYDEALEVITGALEDAEGRLGPAHPILAQHYDNRGSLLSYVERHEEAQRDYLAALEIYRQGLGEDHFEVGRALTNLGVNRLRLGNVEAALQDIRDGHEIKKRSLEPGHPSMAMSANNMGEALRRAGRTQEAIEQFEEAARIWEAAGGDEAPELVLAMAGLVEAYNDLQQWDRCVEYAERGLVIAETAAKYPMGMADFRFAAARCYLGAGNKKKAIELAQRARATYAGTKNGALRSVKELDAWLEENPMD